MVYAETYPWLVDGDRRIQVASDSRLKLGPVSRQHVGYLCCRRRRGVDLLQQRHQYICMYLTDKSNNQMF